MHGSKKMQPALEYFQETITTELSIEQLITNSDVIALFL